MMKFYSVLFTLFLMAFNVPAYAELVQIKSQDLTLNGVLTLAKGKSLANETLIVMVHGTLGHAQMDTLSTLQATLNDHDYNVLSINLSLGQNDRAFQLYPCEQTHTHRHTDALDEIKAWLQWANAQQVAKIILLGHSRGGNQAAWFVSQNEVHLMLAALVLLSADDASQCDLDRDTTKPY
jgi:dipeptidyl aminopeptidase/acylaminoacyl peptidase